MPQRKSRACKSGIQFTEYCLGSKGSNTIAIETTGRIIDQHTGSVAEGLRVEIWDRDRALLQALGSGISDAGGSFRIEVERAMLERLFRGRLVALFFKVFQGDELEPVESNGETIVWRLDDPRLMLEILVNLQLAATQGRRATCAARMVVLLAWSLCGPTIKL